MAFALITMASLIVAAATGLQMASSNFRATRNYRGATQVHFAAESGITEALQVINGPGVVNFQSDVVNRWTTLWGTSAHSFSPLAGFTYNVTAVATPGDTAQSGRLISTAWGVDGVKNVAVANIQRSEIPSTAPGAIYLASDAPTNSTFNGNRFTVDGNDRNYTGGAGPGAPIPGISARNDTNTQEAINSLALDERNQVTGLGYVAGPPTIPSIFTSPAAPSVELINQIAADLLARPGVVTISDQNINGNSVFGTTAAPQITYFNSASGVQMNGTADGAGIAIVEGDLDILGTLNFKGLILVRGRTSVLSDNIDDLSGNGTVYGTLWTNDLRLTVGGSAIFQYSTQALALANQVAGGAALPSPMKLTSLADCAAVPAGTGGCP
jgi:hypothetical protein